MSVMFAGLVLFFGMHLLPSFTGLRAALIAKLGDKVYRGLYSILSAIGLVTMIIGFARAPADARLFDPVEGAKHAAPLVVPIAFILFAAANMKGHIKAKLRHPMLTGILLWSGVHFLANGDLRGCILFGSFFAYAVVDLVSVILRRQKAEFPPAARFDAMAVAGGGAIAVLFMSLHRLIIGVAAVPWGF